MSSTIDLAAAAPRPAIAHSPAGIRLISRLLLRPRAEPRSEPLPAETLDPAAPRLVTLDREHAVCLDLEAAMMAILVAGAALFAAGLLGYGAAEQPWTADGVAALRALAILAGGIALLSVASGIAGLARLIRPAKP